MVLIGLEYAEEEEVKDYDEDDTSGHVHVDLLSAGDDEDELTPFLRGRRNKRQCYDLPR